ncbi:MAG TPA: autotransporter-associated beta strand repeat-containing protein [Verrucomicrobiae bacterium]|jgi:autotransporter-associated beta strand protein
MRIVQKYSVIAAALLLLATRPATAATGTDTWTGNAGDNNWATAGNWLGVNTPPAAGDTPAFGSPGTGSLTLNNNLTAGTSYLGLTFVLGAPSFTLNGNSITTTGGLVDNSTNLQTVNLPVIMSGSHSVNATTGGTMVLDGVISGSSSGITKTGAGTVMLNGSAANTYTGTTTVNAGTLQENFSNLGSANLISSSSALAFGGGSLQILGNASVTSSQTFASTAINAGGSTITAGPNGGSNPTVALGAMTPAAGGVIQINGPASSTAPTTTSGQTGAAGNGSTTGFQAATATITTTTGSANQAFMSGASGNVAYYCFGTVGQYDFAAVSGSSPYTITGYSQVPTSASGLGTGNDGSYYLATTALDANDTEATTHFDDIAASFTVSANTTGIGGYRYNANSAITTTIPNGATYTTGAILVTPNVGANNTTITSGTAVLESGFRSSNNGGALAIFQNNIEGFLNLNLIIANAKTSTGTWIQSGPGTVAYSGVNTFTGTFYLDGGVSQINANSGLGAPGTSAQVDLNGGTILGNATFSLDNNGSTPDRAVAMANNFGGLAAVTGDTMTVSGVVSGSVPLIIGIPASSSNGNVAGQVPGTGSGTANASVLANGTVALTGANTYSGGTYLDTGTLKISQNSLGSGGVNFNGGNLQWATGSSNDISSQVITFNTTATLDVNGNTVTLANAFGNNSPGNVTITSSTGNGVLNLKGANTYTGSTSVSSGTLNANNTSGSATGTNTVTIQPGAALGGSGTIAGDITLQPGALGSFIIGSQLTANTVTWNNNSVVVNVPGSIPLQPGTYTLMNYNATTSTGSFNTNAPTYTGAKVAPGTSSTITTSGSVVTLTVTSLVGISRTWIGDGTLNDWDYSTTNWFDGVEANNYDDGDLVTFDDTGSNNPAINLTATLQPGSLFVNAAQNYTFSGSGQISGDTTLVKTNTGTLTLLTANNYAGVTFIGQGTLQLGNGTTSGSVGTNIITDLGSFILDLPGNNTFANVISGSGSLTQASSGVLTLSTSNSYTGGTTISAGTLQLSSSGWFGSGSITDNGTLTFNKSANSTISAGISGNGAVSLTGSGTVTLSGINTYNNGTTLSAGTLLVNSSVGSGPVIVNGGTLNTVGSIAGSVTVNSSGTLSGSGSIAGAVGISSGGTLSPGNPVGTLTINNNLTVTSGTMNLTLGTSSDKVVVGGNLNLSGTLNITNGSGFTTTTYTLFTYTGTLTLGSLTLNPPANTIATLDTNTPGQVNLDVQTLSSTIPAFPGALGFGQTATGARFGGSVYYVSNTNDSGAGSFRDAVSHSGRYVLFSVGGTISLASAVSCSSSLYIAGQTAPGGIAIIGHEVSFSTRTNEIVRYLRIRPGSMSSSGEDAINVGDCTNLIFDHVSLEFAGYNNIDATGDNGSDAITVQNSIIGDPMSNGTSDKQGFGAHTEHVGGKFSWYYNLWVSEHNRQPLAKIDTIFVNNTEYNFQSGYTVADTSGFFRHDIINNYFITGPTDPSGGDAFFQMNANQTIYPTGNLLDNDNNGALDGNPIDPGGGYTPLSAPWSSLSTNTTVYSATGAFHYDTSWSGAMPPDQLDSLILSQISTLGNGTAGTGAGTAGPGSSLYYDQTSTGLGNNGYGVITPGVAPVDTDGDGIPDYYELATGSNPNVADSLNIGVGGYTKLENYLNWLAAPNAVTTVSTPINVDLSQYARGFINFSPVYLANNASNGTVSVTGSIASFTPTYGYSGLGSFQFIVQANDGSVMTNTIGVCITPYGAVTNNTTTSIGSISITPGGNLVLTGAGGITNSSFILLSSTNVGAPLANWIPVATNSFDANGNFNFTNPLPPGSLQTFYLLELP